MLKTKYQLIPHSVDGSLKTLNKNSNATKKDASLKVFFACGFLFILFFYKLSEFENLESEFNRNDIPVNNTVSLRRTKHNEAQTRPADNLTADTIEETNIKYFVNTPHCRMQYVDPLSPEILKKYKPLHKTCPSTKDFGAIISVIYNANTRKYLLHFNKDIARKYSKSRNSKANDVNCCYREVIRSGTGSNADTKFNLLPCSKFHQDFVVPNHIDAMLVYCTSITTHKTVQQDAFSFVQYRENTNKKPKSGRRPNVLMIGIDSLSRINFRRTMPKTFDFVRRNKWFELQGYNKMGDNTFPNLMAVMTGFNLTTSTGVCKPKTVGGLDGQDCPILWKYYKEAGYRTAYGEDTPQMSTFNYIKRGFNNTPTDYYLRPMMMAVNKHLEISKMSGLNFCVGRHQQAEYVYDFAREFACQYSDEPTFGLFWSNSFSHNAYDAPSTMDKRMLEYMEDFEKRGILENTIMIFFSDHGMRWGTLLSFPEGFVEERWPMFFIHLPKWFRDENPSIVQALQVNQNRLTSPYDINLTLKHILEMYDPDLKLPEARGCPKCQSIFKPVPEERTCADVGVTDHWCTCIPFHTANSKIAKKITNLIVAQMNKYFEIRNITKLCSKMTLKQVKSALIRVQEDTAPKTEKPTYRIKYITNPREASFEATCLYDQAKQKIQLKVESISRLNSYENDSKCIDDKQAKKYCICKNVVKAKNTTKKNRK